MTAQIRPAASSIDAEAREWFVRLLDDDVAPDELAAWSRWVESDPACAEAYERVARTWGLAAAVEVDAPAAAELARDAYSPVLPVGRWRGAQRGRPRLVIALRTAAVAAAIGLVGAGAAYFMRSKPAPQQFATERAQQMHARLADGSEVRLGAMTVMKVAYGGDKRSIGLDKGEALFQVAHDRSRPFVVDTPLAAITAVGTAFNIDVGTSTVTLDVTEGVVSVRPTVAHGRADRPGENSPLLQVVAGQRLRMEREGGRLLLAQSEMQFAPSWTEGRLEFRGEPLRSVIDDVNRYASRRVVIADRAVGDLTYTGTVRLDSADDWVLGLPEAFPLTVELNDNQELVLKEKVQRPVPLRYSETS